MANQQNDIRYYMHKNKKLRTHFYDKNAWMLHLGYYIFYIMHFLKKKIKNNRNFEIQSSELISQILPEIEKLCSRNLL